MAPAGASSISVTVRVRPFTIREAAQLTRCDDTTLFLGDGSLAAAPTPKLSQKGLRSVIKVVDDKCLVFDPPEDNPVQKFSRSVVPSGKRVKDQTFGFDRIFDENATQAEVYEATARPLINNVLEGYNATVFAYGATGCGKTHTITGTPAQPGTIFLTMQELFERITETSTEKVTELSLSYLEIYNETIRDLLSPSNQRGGLMLREDATQAVSVAGLSTHHPKNVEEVMEMIIRGNELRTMSPTEANATSSRSHAVLQINVAQKDRNASVEEPHTMATLSIIDLAGSERASATKNRGERLLEGANINKSLLALGSCINALCDPRKHNHVPYRNSKLTRLLKFSLGGNCKTVMIVCVSPSSAHFDETQNTLRYANRAKNIQTKVTRNVYNVNRHVKDFLVKIDEQMALINELRAQQKDFEQLAFAKFRKQTEKKECIAREGITRIKSAYEHSASDRADRINNLIKMRQLGRRSTMLSSWIAAFDAVCDEQEEAEPMKNMQAIRKTAQGMLVELENGYHYCQQKASKSSWDRGLNSALDNALRQLQEVDTGDNMDAETLRREVELLRTNAEREMLTAVADFEKAGDAQTTQVLLRAHFETMASLDRLNSMSVDQAIEAANTILGKVLQSASNAVSYVVQPDGSLAPVEAFAPSKTGTPKRRKQNFSGIEHSPRRTSTISVIPNHVAASPVRSSPKRQGLLGSAKKGVKISFTPKKRKSPLKNMKRAVRWRDDNGDGSLVDFAKSPQKFEPSPVVEESMEDDTAPQLSDLTASLAELDTNDSSPIPPPPEAASTFAKNDRFKTGFLTKRTQGSPPSFVAPTLTHLSSSDTEPSPLRELNSSSANRCSITPLNAPKMSDLDSVSSGSNSDAENRTTKDEAMKIGSAVRRSSSVRKSGVNAARTQRRRSPTAATAGSPPNESMFAASHVRRMVHGQKENDWKAGILSPRVHGVVSASKSYNSARRITTNGADPRVHSREPSMSTADRAALRLSSVTPSHSLAGRGSLMPGNKAVWRG